MAANGAQFGVYTVHYYWVGAVPAMVFLGIVMMPFYYGSKVRSVPEYLRLRFNRPTHFFNALTFALATVLIAGVNLYALALVLHADARLADLARHRRRRRRGARLHHARRPLLGDLQRGAAVLRDPRGADPADDRRPARGRRLGRAPGQRCAKVNDEDDLFHSWQGTGIGNVDNPLGASWVPIVFGLGFVLSFGYWTTNFAEVQRALSAKSLSAARRTPLIGAYPKIFIPAITIIPGLVALATIPGLGGGDPDKQFNNAIPLLMNEFLPNGMLGIALAGLLAAFMAGVAANVSAFNTVVTYDLWEPYVRSGESDAYYLRFGRIATVTGIVIGIGTALIASGYNNIMDYIQTLFSLLQRAAVRDVHHRHVLEADDAVGGLLGPDRRHRRRGGDATTCNKGGVIDLGSDQAAAFWGACVGVRRRRHRQRRRVAVHAAQARSRSCRASSTAWPTRRSTSRRRTRRGTASHGCWRSARSA